MARAIWHCDSASPTPRFNAAMRKRCWPAGRSTARASRPPIPFGQSDVRRRQRDDRGREKRVAAEPLALTQSGCHSPVNRCRRAISCLRRRCSSRSRSVSVRRISARSAVSETGCIARDRRGCVVDRTTAFSDPVTSKRSETSTATLSPTGAPSGGGTGPRDGRRSRTRGDTVYMLLGPSQLRLRRHPGHQAERRISRGAERRAGAMATRAISHSIR